MSFSGSAARIWHPLVWDRAQQTDNTWAKIGWYTLAVSAIALAWLLVLCWYVIFGLFVIPYRLIRRGQRKRQVEEARHREALAVAGERRSLPSEPPQEQHATPEPKPVQSDTH